MLVPSLRERTVPEPSEETQQGIANGVTIVNGFFSFIGG
jgi:hypothetical protein